MNDNNQEVTGLMGKVSEITIYPVKSLRGIAASEALITAEGLAFDRRWMVTTASGQFLTQRQCPAMATIATALTEDSLVLTSADGQTLRLSLGYPQGNPDPVIIFGKTCSGVDMGDEAAAWLTAVLGKHKGESLRLKCVPENNTRRVEPEVLGDTIAYTGFADGYPFLIGSASSLEALNERLHDESDTQVTNVPINRFRPNVVIEGAPAFAEHRHGLLRHQKSNYALRLCKPCKRCKITTVDQYTGVMPEPKEPLRTLAQMTHIADAGAFFGENAIVETGVGQYIRIGDDVIFEGER
ncbi:MOSC domain-containing protein [Phytohalomonas tamaricis]|uniref:MOSC domain-containing protein n=1 Tax=Phytohalomonas tamaricis TaxID=2081032 RepID=UPI000D0BE224|nr:MOSC N-terminal beta barrel domain-containing protein [Phytohalomonas tamaricis]